MQPTQRARPNDLLRWQRQQRGWSLQRVADEIRLLCGRDGRNVGITAHMVGTWERGAKHPSPLYREKLCQLYGASAERLGLLGPGGPGLPGGIHRPAVPHARAARGTAGLFDDLLRTLDDILDPDDLEMRSHAMRRRTFLQRMAGVTGAAIVSPPLTLLGTEPWERLSTALGRPASLDAATVGDLETITSSYAELSGKVANGTLVGPVLEHLRTISDLLRAQPASALRSRLCLAAGHAAMLAGWLLFGTGDNAAARAYYQVAFDAVREGGDPALAAYVIGSMSFIPSLLEQPHDALRLVQQAQRIGQRSAPPGARAWLCALEAEAHATMGDAPATRDALGRAERFAGGIAAAPAPRWIAYFNDDWLAGFSGVCHLRLTAPGDARSPLEQALGALGGRRAKQESILMTDLATCHLQRGDVDEACQMAGQAGDLAARYRAVPATRRLERLRVALEPWAATPHVKDLDERLRASFRATGT